MNLTIIRPLMLLAVFSFSGGGQAETLAVPDVSVNDLMVTIVTPATNTLWGVDDPQSDDEWKVLDDAAIATIDAFTQIKEGGSGEKDVTWSANPDWDAWADEVIDAGEAARRAIAERHLDALFDANDVLYPPCENCHLKYHPGVAGAEPP